MDWKEHIKKVEGITSQKDLREAALSPRHYSAAKYSDPDSLEHDINHNNRELIYDLALRFWRYKRLTNSSLPEIPQYIPGQPSFSPEIEGFVYFVHHMTAYLNIRIAYQSGPKSLNSLRSFHEETLKDSTMIQHIEMCFKITF